METPLDVYTLPGYLSTNSKERSEIPKENTMSDSLIDETEFVTREAWLMTAIEHFRPWFEEKCGISLPETVKISTGWSKNARAGAIGWTWISSVAEDKVNNVFISPQISDSVEVLAVTLHELIHVADDCQHGHTGAFKGMWQKLGFTGKPTCSTPGAELKDDLEALVCIMGDYPHAKMIVGEGGKNSGPKKQGTRMIKVECACCGYIVRTTQKWLDKGNPSCPSGTEMVPEIA